MTCEEPDVCGICRPVNAAKVTLTDAEESRIERCVAAGDRGGAMGAVESIVAARIAEALRNVRQQLLDLLATDHLPDGVDEHPEGCCDICDWVGCLQDEQLLAIADEYAPRTDS